ncbi:MAG: hypothetical protein WAO61_04075 [Solirubrobacterales bacterium]
MAETLQHPVPFKISDGVLATDPTQPDRFVYAPTLAMYDPNVGLEVAVIPFYQLDRAAFMNTYLTTDPLKTKDIKRYKGLDKEIERYVKHQAQMEKTIKAAEKEAAKQAEEAFVQLHGKGSKQTSGKGVQVLGGGAAKPGIHVVGEAAGAGEMVSQSFAMTAGGYTLAELNAMYNAAMARGDFFEAARLAGIIAIRTIEEAVNNPMGSADATITTGGGSTSSGGGNVHGAVPVTSTPAPTSTTGPPPPPGGTTVGVPPPPPSSNQPPAQPVQEVLASELAILFLDRTRIRPKGLALGEHVYSLSLAPGEHVTLEEKTYSKKEESFEESSEQEKTFDTEMSSTLTTELNEGMTSERSHNSTDADSMGLNVGGDIFGITFNVGPTWSSSLQDADRATANNSVKSSQVGSSKIAARNRAQHKTVFKVSTESRFESTSQRTIQNPNPNTPIDVQYFKVMQRLELSHERYGARLCWAPAVPEPGLHLFAQLEAAKRAVYAKADQASAGARPQQPQPPTSGGVGAPRVLTASEVANNFDPVWGGQRYDYIVNIDAPTGYEWFPDRDIVRNSLKFSFSGRRPAGAEVTSVLPTPTGVKIVVHVGVEDNANPFKSSYWEARGTASFVVSARFVAESSAAAGANDQYRKDMEAWRAANVQWEATDKDIKEAALKEADAEWEVKRKEILASVNVMHETIGAIVNATFLPKNGLVNVRDIDFWQDLFDWKNAAMRLYPAWWAHRESRDPDGPPDSFVNASWARLYLPIKVGFEDVALRWIYDRVMFGKASASTEQLISRVTNDLDGYRKQNFGSRDEIVLGSPNNGNCATASEKFTCLGKWEETIPTDGTHAEVMQATSSAADDYARDQLSDADAERAERLERTRRENQLIEAAGKEGVENLDTEIDINLNLGDGSSP